MRKGVNVIGRIGENGRVTHFEYRGIEYWAVTSEFEKMTDSDFVKLHEDSMSDKKKWEEVKKRIEKERASMTPEERAGWDEADRAVFERWMRRIPTPFLTDASLKEKTRISILSDESCELLSNFVSLTDCKQP